MRVIVAASFAVKKFVKLHFQKSDGKSSRRHLHPQLGAQRVEPTEQRDHSTSLGGSSCSPGFARTLYDG